MSTVTGSSISLTLTVAYTNINKTPAVVEPQASGKSGPITVSLELWAPGMGP